MSDDAVVAALSIGLLLAVFLFFGSAVYFNHREMQEREQSFRICVQAGRDPAQCRLATKE